MEGNGLSAGSFAVLWADNADMRTITRSALAVIATAAVVVGGVLPGPSQAAANPGRILGAGGVAWGPILMYNADGTYGVHLTANSFSSNTKGAEPNYKSMQPSQSNTNVIAFASNRDEDGMRIFTMKVDGSGIRKLTSRDGAVNAQGFSADDRGPVISPNGRQIAFISRRSGVMATPMNNAQDIFIVNSNGSGIRQVTVSQTDGRSDSYVRSVVWSPDGTKLAFRGTRLVLENGNQVMREVLGFIKPDGSEESHVVTNDCAGGAALDWRGSKVLYSYGGAVQGCQYNTDYLIRDVASGATTVVKAESLQGAPNGDGAARLSPDARRIAFTTRNPAGGVDPSVLVTIGIDGADRAAAAGQLEPGGWIWWAPGAAYAKPKSFTITPKQVLIKRGKTLQLIPMLKDAKGRALSRSGADWTWAPGSSSNAVITTTGKLITTKDTTPGVVIAQIGNGGLTAKVKITIT